MRKRKLQLVTKLSIPKYTPSKSKFTYTEDLIYYANTEYGNLVIY